MSKAKKLVLLAAVAVGLAAALFLIIRPMPWQTLAIRSEEALFDARGERLRGYFHPEELRALGISEDIAIKAINEIVAPGLAGQKPDRSTRQFSEVETRYAMTFLVSQRVGDPLKSYIPVTITERGPRVLLSDLIATSRFMIMSGIGKDNESVWHWKLSEQGKALKALGIRGYWHIGTNQIDEWPEYPVVGK